jgi:hypothetical protein
MRNTPERRDTKPPALARRSLNGPQAWKRTQRSAASFADCERTFTVQTWAVIVAGSEPSVLRQTIERTARIVDEDRIVVVASEAREAMACEVLAERGGIYLALEPRDRGTAASALFGLAFTLEVDPDAIVHLAAPETTFRVIAAEGESRERAPDHASMGAGCVLWEIIEEHMPEHAAAIRNCGSRDDLVAAYEAIAHAPLPQAALARHDRVRAVSLETEPLRKTG